MSWRLKSPGTGPFDQKLVRVNNKSIIKALHYLSTDDRHVDFPHKTRVRQTTSSCRDIKGDALNVTSIAYTCNTAQLTHWGRVTHTCVSKLNIIGSDNGLSPGRCQAIIWTNAEILSIGPLGTNFSENLIEINSFPFKKTRLKMWLGIWRPFCLGLNVLICIQLPLSWVLFRSILSVSFRTTPLTP